jgi:hypothetical protein
MRKWIDESKETYLKAEEEVARVTPALFLEFAEADDEARQDYTVCIRFSAHDRPYLSIRRDS